MKVLVINLDSAKDRHDFQTQQLSSYNLDYEFLSATSTKDIKPETYQQHYHDWQRPLKETEVACYYSHRSAWKKVLDDNQPILILEDDALLSKYIVQLLSALEKKQDADLINLENRGRKKFVSKVGRPIACNSQLLQLYQDRTGAACYILWPSGAQKLLECEQKNGIALADAHITACHTLNAYQVEPSAAIQLDYCEHYQIPNPTNQTLAQSTVSSRFNNKGGWLFWLKRIYHQIKLGWRQLRLLRIAQRRYIRINVKDFYQQTD